MRINLVNKQCKDTKKNNTLNSRCHLLSPIVTYCHFFFEKFLYLSKKMRIFAV